MTGKIVGDKFFLKGLGTEGWREVTEKEWRKAMKPPKCNLSSGAGLIGFKALHSDSLGVHPKQIKEATEDAAKKGVPTEFDKKGRPIFTSRSHRKRYCQQYGFFDRDGGYSDAQRGDVRRVRDVPEELTGEALAREYFDG